MINELNFPGGSSPPPTYFPGTPDLRAAAAIDVAAGATVRGINFTAVPIQTRHVRGVVQGRGAHVLLAPLNPAPGSTATPRDLDARSGTFDFADVAPGDYLVIAQSVDKSGRVHIDVRDSDVNDVIVELRAGLIVPTKVTIDGHPPSENDPAYRYIRFNLMQEPSLNGIRGPIYSTFLNGSLGFELTPGEDYRIVLVAVPDAPPELQRTYIQSIRMGTHDVLNEGIQFNGEADAKIEIVIGTHPGSLSGSVTDNQQIPSINTTVVLVPDMARRQRSDAYKTAITDASGRFQLASIPPGEYKAFAWNSVEDGAWQDADFLRHYEDLGMPIHIVESGAVRISLPVIP
jgi:hypothetical protein